MIQNKAVVHFQDGQILKGIVNDFSPNNKEFFHLIPVDPALGSKPLELQTASLKALFFVKDYRGNPFYREKKEFDPSKPLLGRKVKVTFKDGEVMVGATSGYQLNRPGFFLFPVDGDSNNERCYVVTSATKEILFV